MPGINASVGNFVDKNLRAGGNFGGMAHIGWGAAGGAGAGATYGMFSDNETMFGGAFKGALMGAGAGAGSRYVSGRYASGAAAARNLGPQQRGFSTSYFTKPGNWNYF
jgi:hypothetical protein